LAFFFSFFSLPGPLWSWSPLPPLFFRRFGFVERTPVMFLRPLVCFFHDLSGVSLHPFSVIPPFPLSRLPMGFFRGFLLLCFPPVFFFLTSSPMFHFSEVDFPFFSIAVSPIPGALANLTNDDMARSSLQCWQAIPFAALFRLPRVTIGRFFFFPILHISLVVCCAGCFFLCFSASQFSGLFTDFFFSSVAFPPPPLRLVIPLFTGSFYMHLFFAWHFSL